MMAEFTLERITTGLQSGRILVARCTACGSEHAFPTPACFSCGKAELLEIEHAGTGAVFSWVVNHHPFDGEDRETPYTVLLVELDGGARIYGNLARDAETRGVLAGGMRVRLDRDATVSSGRPVFAAEVAGGGAGRGSVPFRTCYTIFREVARERAARTAIELLGFQTLTYDALLDRIDRCAALLVTQGIGRGDRVAVVSHNRVEVLELWLACSRIGAVFVPLNPALRGPILSDMLELAEPTIAVCEPAALARLQEARPGVRCSALDELQPDTMTDWGDGAPGAPADDPGALSIIMFTSGTTGRSKGVMWSSMTIANMAASLAATMELDAEDRLHTALPMFHGNALILSVFNALMLGATAVVSRKFSASRFSDELEQGRATATSFLGSMTIMVLARSPDRPFRGVLKKALVIPAPPTIIDQLTERFGCRCASAYGLADAGLPLFTGLDFPDGVCGRPFDPLWEARVVDPRGEEVIRGSVGELVVRPRAPHVASLGYWRMPDETEAWRRDGWIRTGDLMRQDADGWFTFVDRTKDAIRRRGENVSSQELEAVFEQHPDVVECAAYPVPSEMSEDEIMLAVVRRPGSELTADDLIGFVEPKLPYFAVPRFIRFVESLPKNAMEKVLKAELRREGVVPGTWDLAASAHEVSR
jgi:crotonobetaine/carnitine-CoA ligase